MLPCGLAAVAATEWSKISPLLTTSFRDALPTPPSAASASHMFQGVMVGGGAPFAAFTITAHEDSTLLTDTTAAVKQELVACNATANESILIAGPSVYCPANSGTCRGNQAGTRACKAAMNQHSVQLNSRHGVSGWAPASAHPSYIQYTFPALPQGASSVTLRYEMDSRYQIELSHLSCLSTPPRAPIPHPARRIRIRRLPS